MHFTACRIWLAKKKLKKALNKKVSWFFGPFLGGVGGSTPHPPYWRCLVLSITLVLSLILSSSRTSFISISFFSDISSFNLVIVSPVLSTLWSLLRGLSWWTTPSPVWFSSILLCPQLYPLFPLVLQSKCSVLQFIERKWNKLPW